MRHVQMTELSVLYDMYYCPPFVPLTDLTLTLQKMTKRQRQRTVQSGSPPAPLILSSDPGNRRPTPRQRQRQGEIAAAVVTLCCWARDSLHLETETEEKPIRNVQHPPAAFAIAGSCPVVTMSHSACPQNATVQRLKMVVMSSARCSTMPTVWYRLAP